MSALAKVTDLSEFKLHRECQAIAYRLRSGTVVLHLREVYPLSEAHSRALAEALNDALSRCDKWEPIPGWYVHRWRMRGHVWLISPTEEMCLDQERAELHALALARAVGP